MSYIFSVLAVVLTNANPCAGVASGFICSHNANAPAICGDAILVPLILLIKNAAFAGYGLAISVAPNLLLVLIALMISVPGA